MSAQASAPEKPWRQMKPKELVYTLVKKEKPELTENTLKTYASQLATFLTTVGAKTIGGAYEKSYKNIEDALKKVENANSKASQLNAFLSVVKYAKIPMGEAKYQKLMTLNDTLRDEKMKPMEQGVGEAPPDDFAEKVDAYLADPKTKGTREAVFIATMALAPTVRPKQFEDVKVARSQEEYDALKGAGQSVLGAFGTTYLLWTKPENRKVKSIDTPVKYTGKALEALKAYLKPDQTLLFPTKKYPTQSVKSQMIEKAIKQAFDDAKIGFIGAQKLRRIVETKNQNDPSKSREEKEEFSKQMNHGKDMGDKYKVVKDKNVERTEEADLLYTVYGDRMAEIQSIMPKVEDEETLQEIVIKLEDVLSLIKGKPKPKPQPKPQPKPKEPELPKGAIMYRGKSRVMPKEEVKQSPAPKPKTGTTVFYGGRARVLPA